MILVISNKDDLTTDFVILELKNKKIPYYRLNTEDLFTNIAVHFDIGNDEFLLRDVQTNRIINLKKDVTSVYFRRPLLPDTDNFNLKPDETMFAQKEFYYAIEGIYSALKDKFWVSNPNDIRIAENKILQLQVAKQLGFNIPKSIISSDNICQFNFLSDKNGVIKPIKVGLVSESEEALELVYTSPVSLKEVKENKSKFPLYLQEKIDKVADIRATVIGSKIFAAKIQYKNLEMVDWREVKKENVLYERYTLPSDVSDLCIRLLSYFKLNFGAIDLALDENGNYVFFEINANGQWAWLDMELGSSIAAEIANVLIKGASNV